MWAVAAPVMLKRRMIAALWIAAPERRLDPARQASLREATRAAAAALSRQLARPAALEGREGSAMKARTRRK
jgi:DNA-binding IclR family transcriptional regulator